MVRVTSTAGLATLSRAGSVKSQGNSEEDVIYPLHNYLLLAFGLLICVIK